MKTNKAKIGLVTFHCAENYGAFLQALAMQEWLNQSVGDQYDIQFVDYRPDYLSLPYKVSLQKYLSHAHGVNEKLKALTLFLLETPNKLLRKYRFTRAQRVLRTTAKRYKRNNFQLDDYYALILGSDQIWNPNITNGIDKAYFGSAASAQCLKIAYAASIGVNRYSDQDKKILSELLGNLDGIGVREQHSVEILQPLCKQKVIVNIDPTFLIDREIWSRYLQPVREKKYILIYKLQENSAIFADAYKIAKQTGRIILHFGDPSLRPIYPDVKVKSLSYCGPFEFLSYIQSADLVLTNSFHATCFSLIFEKEFYVYLQKERSERILSMAQICGFEDRLIPAGHTLDIEGINATNSQSTQAYHNLGVLQAESKQYLLSKLAIERGKGCT